MPRKFALGVASACLAVVCLAADADARGRRSSTCTNCQYSVPTVQVFAAEPPAPPVEAAAEEAAAAPVASEVRTSVSSSRTGYYSTPTRGYSRLFRYRR